MAEIKFIKRHNEVSEGDYLVQIEEVGQEINTVLIPKENGKSRALSTLIWLVNDELSFDTKATYTLLEYLSPLKQIVLKTIRIS